MKLIDRFPWFPFVLAFVALIGAWTTMIVIALNNRPEQVPLEHVQSPPPTPQPAPESN